MQHLWALIPPGTLGTVVHIGAGSCEGLSGLVARDPAQVWLVDPDPALPEAVRMAAPGDARVQILPVAVGDASGPGTLHVMNFAEFSALDVPQTQGIKDIFPGLREISQHPVQVLSLADVLARIDLVPDRPALLVLEAPGQEVAILRAAREQSLFKPFEHIILRSFRHAAFDTDLGPEALPVVLEALGYVAVPDGQRPDPEWQETLFQRHEALLRQQEQALELEAERTSRMAMVDRMAEREKVQARLEAELDAARARVTRAEAAQSDTELQAARTELSLVLRRQELQAADMAELQGRYSALEQDKAEVEGLLGTVTSQLRDAVAHMRRLEDQLAAASPVEVIEAETVPGGRTKRRAGPGSKR